VSQGAFVSKDEEKSLERFFMPMRFAISPISGMKTYGFLAFPATDGVAVSRLSYGFLLFGFSLLKVFDHLLEFRF